MVLGASSINEAATAAQRGIDNMLKIDGLWRRQPSLGCECSETELFENTWLTWVLYDLGWYRPADVQCPKVNLLGSGERHTDLARVLYRQPGTGRDGNGDLPRGESCSQGSAVDHPARGIKSGEARQAQDCRKDVHGYLGWHCLFLVSYPRYLGDVCSSVVSRLRGLFCLCPVSFLSFLSVLLLDTHLLLSLELRVVSLSFLALCEEVLTLNLRSNLKIS